jgi:WD40 repeat protein
VAFSPDGQSLAAGDILGRVWLWHLKTRQVLASWVGHAQFIYCVAFSPDGKLLATGNNAGSVKLWDARAGTELAHYQEHTDAITAVAFSPDGHWLASGSIDKTLVLRRLGTQASRASATNLPLLRQQSPPPSRLLEQGITTAQMR